jgi:nucleoside 2-deoxyribosyltransferase
MNKIFLAAPFKSVVDEKKSEMDDKSKEQISSLITFLEGKGYRVHNAHKREQWGHEFMTPEQCTKIDYDEIEKCDIFIAFPGIPPSPGTHIEIGWASVFHKKIFILLQGSKEKYAYLIRGLDTVADVTYIVYSEDEEYYKELNEYL